MPPALCIVHLDCYLTSFLSSNFLSHQANLQIPPRGLCLSAQVGKPHYLQIEVQTTQHGHTGGHWPGHPQCSHSGLKVQLPTAWLHALMSSHLLTGSSPPPPCRPRLLLHLCCPSGLPSHIITTLKLLLLSSQQDVISSFSDPTLFPLLLLMYSMIFGEFELFFLQSYEFSEDHI